MLPQGALLLLLLLLSLQPPGHADVPLHQLALLHVAAVVLLDWGHTTATQYSHIHLDTQGM